MKPCAIPFCDELAPNSMLLCRSCRDAGVVLHLYETVDQVLDEWRDVEFMDGYQVSSRGHVRSCVKTASIWRTLRPFIKRDGYMLVQMGRGFKEYVHRLVAHEFVPERRYDQNEVNHLDTNRSHNCYQNLVWTTRSENVAHEKEAQVFCDCETI